MSEIIKTKRRNIYEAADDFILPYTIYQLIKGYIREFKPHSKWWKQDADKLYQIMQSEMRTLAPRIHDKYITRLHTGAKLTNEYFRKNKFSTYKGLATVIHASQIIEDYIKVRPDVDAIYQEIVLIMNYDAYVLDEKGNPIEGEVDEDGYPVIDHLPKERREKIIRDRKLLASAAKQAPKLLKLLQKQKFFEILDINS
jgi:hypothetical protein